MNVSIKNGKLVIELDIKKSPSLSGSQKNLLVATTGGNKLTDVKVNGKNVTIGVNAYIPVE